MNFGLHSDKYICRGKCPMAHASFFERCLVVAKAKFPPIATRLQLPAEVRVVFAKELPNLVNTIDLIDRRIELVGFRIVVSSVTTPEIGNSIFREFCSELFKEISTNFAEETQLLLWCLMKTRNLNMLKSILEKLGKKVPKCTLQSLLLEAIQLKWVDGVQLLIDCGAIVVQGLQSDDCNSQPKVVCLQQYQRLVLTSLQNDRWEENVNETVANLDKIAGMLLFRTGFKQTDLPEDAVYPDSALPLLSYVAALSPQIAERLIDKGCLLDDDANCADEYEQSALQEAFNDIDNLPFFFHEGIISPFNAGVVAKMFQRAVLPLLRAGVRCGGLVDQTINLAALVNTYEQFGRHLWGDETRLMALALETCVDGPVDLAELQGMMEFSDDVTGPQMAHFIRLAREWKLKPRKLQALARRTVLRQLPLCGLKRRHEAIESLLIPKCLRNYLEFAEFNVFPHLLA